MENKELKWKIEYIEDGIEKKEEGKALLGAPLHFSITLHNAIIKSVEGIVKIDISDDDRFFLNGYQTWTYSKEIDRKGKLTLVSELAIREIEFEVRKYGE